MELQDLTNDIEDLYVEDLKKIFKNIDTFELILEKDWAHIDFTVSCSDRNEENEHKINDRNPLYNNAAYISKVLLHSANVIDKSSKLFNKNPNKKNEVEVSWNEGNFGMGVSISIYLTINEIVERCPSELGNKLKSIIALKKFNI